jgi:hypothetical protein
VPKQIAENVSNNPRDGEGDWAPSQRANRAQGGHRQSSCVEMLRPGPGRCGVPLLWILAWQPEARGRRVLRLMVVLLGYDGL